MNRLETATLRKTVNHVFLWLLLYLLFNTYFSYIAGSSPSLMLNLSVVAGFVLLLLLTRRNWPIRIAEKGPRQMTGKTFLGLLSIFLLCQLISSLLALLATRLGLNDAAKLVSASLEGENQTFWMVLYAGFIGPIAEEVVYRGFALKTLSGKGKLLAIMLSSLAFGLMHMNLSQIFAGIFTGLIMGYICLEYSIWWSLLIHIFNNFVLVELPAVLVPARYVGISDAAQYVLFGIGSLYAIWLLVRNRKEIAAYLGDSANRAGSGASKQVLGSGWFIVFVVYCIGMMLLISLAASEGLIPAVA